jgi:hypothetical protein
VHVGGKARHVRRGLRLHAASTVQESALLSAAGCGAWVKVRLVLTLSRVRHGVA